MTTLTQQSSTVDRQQASKILNVSVRTIDRYIKSGRLPAYQKSGRIWLRKSDIIELSKGTLVTKHVDTQTDNVIRGTSARSNSSFSNAPSAQEINALIHNANQQESQITQTAPREFIGVQADASFYKDLYEEAQKRLNDSQKKHEHTQAHMSELETQILRLTTSQQGMIAANIAAQTAPIMKHSDSNEGFKIDLLKKEVEDKEKEITILKELVVKEKDNKTAFAVITYTLLALQPVFWYFLR